MVGEKVAPEDFIMVRSEHIRRSLGRLQNMMTSEIEHREGFYTPVPTRLSLGFFSDLGNFENRSSYAEDYN